MTTPVLHLVAGPNGAGKSEFAARVLLPVTHLPFINADEIAAARWPGDEARHAYEAAAMAADEREAKIAAGESFVTETVFSHQSKVDLVVAASAAGYLVTLHVLLVPVELAVARVPFRVELGGHAVPEDKIRSRFERLWTYVATAVGEADESYFYDNTRAAHPFRRVATFRRGRLVGAANWPLWTPEAITELTA